MTPFGEVVATALASLVPVVGGALAVLLQAAFERDRLRFAQTVLDVEAETGAERLRQRVEDNRQVESVFLQGLEGAAHSGMEAKRRLLVDAISMAVLDEGRVNEAHVRVMVLKELEVPHVLTLEKLRRAEVQYPRASEQATREQEVAAKAIMADQSGLRATLGDVRLNTWSPIVAALDRLGLTLPQPRPVVAGNPVNALTPFARDLLDDLHKRGTQELSVDGVPPQAGYDPPAALPGDYLM